MATLRQSANSNFSGADPASLTLSSTPNEGNLLVAIVSERSGGDADNHTVSGATWTHEIAETTQQGNGTHRRSFSMFWKVAGASESTSISADDGTGNHKWLAVLEFEPEGDEDQWELLESAMNDNGATVQQQTIATGTTASVSGDTFFSVAAVMTKRDNTGATTSASWTNSFATDLSVEGSGFDMGHVIASMTDSVEAAKSSEVSGLIFQNSGLNAGILVWSVVDEGGGGPAGTPYYYRGMMG